MEKQEGRRPPAGCCSATAVSLTCFCRASLCSRRRFISSLMPRTSSLCLFCAAWISLRASCSSACSVASMVWQHNAEQIPGTCPQAQLFPLAVSKSHSFSDFFWLLYPALLPLQAFLPGPELWSLPGSVLPGPEAALASSLPAPAFCALATALHSVPCLLRLTCPFSCCSFTSSLSSWTCWQAWFSCPRVWSSVSDKEFFSFCFSSRTCTEGKSRGLDTSPANSVWQEAKTDGLTRSPSTRLLLPWATVCPGGDTASQEVT